MNYMQNLVVTQNCNCTIVIFAEQQQQQERKKKKIDWFKLLAGKVRGRNDVISGRGIYCSYTCRRIIY